MAKEKDMEIHYADKPIKCPICGQTRFIPKKALITTRLNDIVNLLYYHPRAKCYVCQECRHILWFSDE